MIVFVSCSLEVTKGGILIPPELVICENKKHRHFLPVLGLPANANANAHGWYVLLPLPSNSSGIFRYRYASITDNIYYNNSNKIQAEENIYAVVYSPVLKTRYGTHCFYFDWNKKRFFRECSVENSMNITSSPIQYHYQMWIVEKFYSRLSHICSTKEQEHLVSSTKGNFHSRSLKRDSIAVHPYQCRHQDDKEV